MIKPKSIGSVVLALTLFNSPAHAADRKADKTSFQRCDGYGYPNDNGDGMTEVAGSFLGLFPKPKTAGGGQLAQPTFGAEGLEACNDALEPNDRLRPEYHLRRANLLRARALHRLAVDQNELALSDLKLAESEGQLAQEPLYDRSAGVGNKLVEAFILDRLGRDMDAVTALEEALRLRPYSNTTQYAAMRIDPRLRQDGSKLQTRLDEVATLHPKHRSLLFVAAMFNGDLEKAIEVSGQIYEEYSTVAATYSRSEDYEAKADIFENKVKRQLDTAFALLASGREAEGNKLILEISHLLQETEDELPLRPNGKKQKRNKIQEHAAKQNRVGTLRNYLKDTQSYFQLFQTAKTGNAEEFDKQLVELNPELTASAIHVFRTLLLSLDPDDVQEADRAQLEEVVSMLEKGMVLPPMTVEELFDALPETETRKNMPRVKSTKHLFGRKLKDVAEDQKNGPIKCLSQENGKARASTMEDLALLSVANSTLSDGKSNFALISEQMIRLVTTDWTMWGTNRWSGGSDARFCYIAFDEGEILSAPYDQLVSRSINAQEVFDDLAAIYLPSQK